MILCEVNKNSLKVRTSELLTAGSREVNEVEFRFNSAWDGVTKTAVFRTEKKAVSVLLDGDKTKLPWEVLADVGEVVAVGVYGVSGETLVLPTVWGIIGKVVDAAKLGDEEKEPTPDVYQQILDKLNSMSWDTLENKPFTSIGSGLKVEDGTLTATAQGGADITITDTAEVGEVLTVEEVDSEGKPTKWKTEKPTAEQKQADWEQNDETAADYVKNRTHYDSRQEETVEKTFTLTSESARMQKLFDDFTYDDIAKLKSMHCVCKYVNSDSGDNESWENDMAVDSTTDISDGFGLTAGSIYLIQALVNDDWTTQLYLIAKEEALSNENITSVGMTTLGLYYDCLAYLDTDAIAESETLTNTWTIVRDTGELKTIEPKYLPEWVQSDWNENDETAKSYVRNRPFYSETASDVVGTGFDGWELTAGTRSDKTIPKLRIKGVDYENVTTSNPTYSYLTYTAGDVVFTVLVSHHTISISTSGIEDTDLEFIADKTTYHTIADEYISGYVELKENVTDVLSSVDRFAVYDGGNTTMLDFVNIPNAKVVYDVTNLSRHIAKTIRKGNLTYTIYSSKTGQAITDAEMPYGVMVLVENASKWYCVNPT